MEGVWRIKPLQPLSVALLVLLTRTAGAGIVAANLLLDMQRHGLLLVALSGLCGGLHARSLQLIHIDLGLVLALRLLLLLAYGNVGLAEDGQRVAIVRWC